MATHSYHPEGGSPKAAFCRRLNDIGWALFLILIGALLLMPEGRVPQGTWLIGAGLIMLGVNAVRSVNGIAINGFTVVLGGLALAAGLGGYLGLDLPLLALFLIVMGVGIILRPWLRGSGGSATP
jgi:hypothetical protein